MPDVGNINPNRESTNAIKKGVTRQHFDKLFGFDKEHTEPTGASSSQSMDYMTSTPEDKMIPFNKDQIKALIERFNPIKEQLEDLKGRLGEMSLEKFDRCRDEMQVQLQRIADQLKQIDQAGDYDGTKQNPLTGDICIDTFNTLKYLYNDYILNLANVREHRKTVTLSESARREFKSLLKDTFECWKRLVFEPMRDAQVKIWEGNYSEDTIANLMRTSEVVSSETLCDGTSKPKKITLRCGLVGVWKPESKDDWFSSYKSEIAAYQIDKLLNLNMVPLTVEREINGEKGSLQLWVHNMSQKGDISLPNDTKFFITLIEKKDTRNTGFIGNGRDCRVVLFDNADAFPSKSDFPYGHGSSLLLTKNVLEKAQQLDMDQLKHIQHLTEEQKIALLERCEELVSRKNVWHSRMRRRPEEVVEKKE